MRALENNDYALGHFDIGTRIHVRAGPHTVVPFVQIGLSGRAISGDFFDGFDTYSVTASGAGVAFGAGLNAHFTPVTAFSAGVTWSAGNFSQYEVEGVSVNGTFLSAMSARVHLGFVWFPQAR